MKTTSSIYLLRTNKILPISMGYVPAEKLVSPQLISTALLNFESIGFTLSDDVVRHLSTSSKDEFLGWYREVFPALQESLGDHVSHTPMYPNFPEQVISASNAELYLNAILHYIGDAVGVRITPDYPKDLRARFDEKINNKVIDLASEEDLFETIKSIVNSKSPYSTNDKEDLRVLNARYHQFGRIVRESDDLKIKENIAFLGALTGEVDAQIKTATDVLRLAVAMSDGDVSLAEKPKFVKMSRANRRRILGLLERSKNIEEDMLRYKEYWKRLGEILHPGEYAGRYPKAFVAFRKLRNNEKIVTFNSAVEKAFKEEDSATLSKLLPSRPGEFARRLEQVLRVPSVVSSTVVNSFDRVAESVSPTVLLQTMNHFQNKIDSPSKHRVVLPKGEVAKVRIIDAHDTVIDTTTCNSVVATCKRALKSIFSSREDLGTVFIDESLKDIAVPTGLRSASNSLETYGRGSRLDFDSDKGTLRFFIHWKDMEDHYGRVDVDLSATSFDENFNSTGDVAYYNLRTDFGVHSGDITSAPNGASEFLDIDIDMALKAGVRYVGMVLYSYTRQNFSEIPECFAGFMTRECAQSGEVYEPASVDNKLDLTVDSTNAVPYIFDLKERKAIWVDLSIRTSDMYPANVASNKSSLALVLEALVHHKPTNLYDLFSLHAEARAERVLNREDADIVFARDGDISPLHVEKILDLYL